MGKRNGKETTLKYCGTKQGKGRRCNSSTLMIFADFGAVNNVQADAGSSLVGISDAKCWFKIDINFICCPVKVDNYENLSRLLSHPE